MAPVLGLSVAVYTKLWDNFAGGRGSLATGCLSLSLIGAGALESAQSDSRGSRSGDAVIRVWWIVDTLVSAWP